MKALETRYNGYRFRSRLEARWAVFMDAIGVAYEYEPEAYDLDGMFYLPDFWLPGMEAYLEIKPKYPTDEETEKASRLAQFTGNTIFILFGQPENPRHLNEPSSDSGIRIDWMETEDNGKISKHPAWDCYYWWCECRHCGRCELQFSGRAERIDCKCPKSEYDDSNYDSPRLLAAYARARGSRFGETMQITML
jgi:hypothetical protein